MFAFGIIDNGVLLLAVLAGASLEDYVPIPRRFRSPVVGAAFGALVGNALSDGLAGLALGVGPALEAAAGCLAVLVAFPLVVWQDRRRRAAVTA